MFDNLDNEIIGFCNNIKINSTPLYIFKNIKSLNSTNLITNKQKHFLTSAFQLETDHFGFFPDENSNLAGAVAIIKNSSELRKSIIDQAAEISKKVPKRKWAVQNIDNIEEKEIYNFFLGWGLSFYQFKLDKPKIKSEVQTLCLNTIRTLINKDLHDRCIAELKGIFLTRDLINLPPNILTPKNYIEIIRKFLKPFGSQISTYEGEKLKNNFPLINFVGRSSENKPALIDIKWNNDKKKESPTIVLIGKGVTFDSGGLDIKPSNSMLLMKKDMGGSAVVLGIGYALMSMNYPVNLRIIIPLAENAVSEKSMRPMDIIYSRNKTPVEIGNTDAEGRLLLADALSFSQEGKDNNDFIIDFATLTGAARVALGTELPALFTNDDDLGNSIISSGIEQIDPVWRMPLFSPYERFLETSYEAISSTGNAGTGGAITAALFLKKFINPNTKWAHIDLMAWNNNSRPGFPSGGEAMGLRNIVNMIINHCNKR